MEKQPSSSFCLGSKNFFWKNNRNEQYFKTTKIVKNKK